MCSNLPFDDVCFRLGCSQLAALNYHCLALDVWLVGLQRLTLYVNDLPRAVQCAWLVPFGAACRASLVFSLTFEASPAGSGLGDVVLPRSCVNGAEISPAAGVVGDGVGEMARGHDGQWHNLEGSDLRAADKPAACLSEEGASGDTSGASSSEAGGEAGGGHAPRGGGDSGAIAAGGDSGGVVSTCMSPIHSSSTSSSGSTSSSNSSSSRSGSSSTSTGSSSSGLLLAAAAPAKQALPLRLRHRPAEEAAGLTGIALHLRQLPRECFLAVADFF
jgi:hypothetical protein